MQQGTAILPVEPLLGLLSEEDTSALAVHLPRLQDRLDHLKSAFPSQVQHAVAIKTNPHPKMLAHLVSAGVGLEAASMEEVERAREAGCPDHLIVFDSPVKTRKEIQAVSVAEGMLVNVNSLEELARYPSEVACTLGIRINPQVDTGAPEIFDVSKNESKFGVGIAHREAIINAALEYPVSALHMHSGSQMKDLEIQRKALEMLRDLALEINAKSAGRIQTLDIGGGLPSEPLEGQTTMQRYGMMVAEVFTNTSFKLVTEFGQWVHAACGFAVSQIEYKLAPNRLFIHLGADFFMRDAYTKPRPFPFTIWSSVGAQKHGQGTSFDIAGPLCFAGDYLAHGAELPENTEEGDYLVVDQTGANTLGLWSRHCSRTVPAVWAWDGQSYEKWSERKTINY